jgi:hypothetical protein
LVVELSSSLWRAVSVVRVAVVSSSAQSAESADKSFAVSLS